MKAETVKMFYFGPWDGPGHHFHDEFGSSYPRDRFECIPWKDWEIDGKLQPHRDCRDNRYCGCGMLPEGIAAIHHKDGWTALSFWDRSVDKRGGCNSTYFAEGDFTLSEMTEMARTRFAHRWNKMKFDVVPALPPAASDHCVGKPLVAARKEEKNES